MRIYLQKIPASSYRQMTHWEKFKRAINVVKRLRLFLKRRAVEKRKGF